VQAICPERARGACYRPSPMLRSIAGDHEAIRGAERSDPFGHAVHVALACAWCFAQVLSNAAEGILWGLMCGFVVLRLPKIWRAYRIPLRDPIWVAWLLLSLWTAASWWWAPAESRLAGSWLPSRSFITPLLLFPLVTRPMLLLGSLGLGCVSFSVATAIRNWDGGGFGSYASFRSLTNFGYAQWYSHLALVICLGMARGARPPLKALAVAAAAAGGLCTWIVGTRMSLVGGALGTWLVCSRPAIAGQESRRAALSMAVLAVLSIAAWFAPGMGRAIGGIKQGLASGDFQRGMDEATGHRWSLATAALDVGVAHPFIGAGRGAFRGALPEWAQAKAQAATDAPRAESYRALATSGISDAHNAFAQSWAEGGTPALLLTSVLFGGLAVRLWRRSGSDSIGAIAFAMLLAVLVGTFVTPTFTRVPMMITGFCLALSWSPVDRPRDRST
jgi:hypothetical protein